jgi:bacterioferritin-associated ferredoxin
MYVCICNGITDGQIRAAVSAGARTLDDLRAELGVAINCACCAPCAEQLVTETLGGQTTDDSRTGTVDATFHPSVDIIRPSKLHGLPGALT